VNRINPFKTQTRLLTQDNVKLGVCQLKTGQVNRIVT
jgi:hypothetical protein